MSQARIDRIGSDTTASTSGPRARTLKGQRLINRLMRGLLRTPLLCRLIGSKLLTVHVVGRVSGKRYVVPVAYLERDGRLLIGTPFGWGRNLRTGTPVEIRLKGRLRTADVRVLVSEAAVVEAYALMAAHNRNFADFNRIGFTPDGRPDPADLQLAWAAGARAAWLTPR